MKKTYLQPKRLRAHSPMNSYVKKYNENQYALGTLHKIEDNGEQVANEVRISRETYQQLLREARNNHH